MLIEICLISEEEYQTKECRNCETDVAWTWDSVEVVAVTAFSMVVIGAYVILLGVEYIFDV